MLGQFLEEEQTRFPNIPVAIPTIMRAMATAAGVMNATLVQAMIDKDNVHTETFNPSGEAQQKLDVLAQQFFLETLEKNRRSMCCYFRRS